MSRKLPDDVRRARQKARRRAHYLANRERTLAVNQAYREKNPELIARLKKEWGAANRDKIRELTQHKRAALPKGARKAEGVKYRMKRGDELKASQKEYYRTHKEQIAARSKIRGAEKRDEIAAKTKLRSIQRWLKIAGWSQAELERRIALGCELCGVKKPLGKAGLVFDHDHDYGHVRGLLCEKCNQRLDWAIQYYEEIGCYYRLSLEAVA